MSQIENYASILLFLQLCNALIDAKRYKDFEDISLFGMMCPIFQQTEESIRVSLYNQTVSRETDKEHI